ncbi:MAG: hypothetical protein AAF715_31690 [Myxococcota bacterium]
MARPGARLVPVVGSAPTGPIGVRGLVELAELGLAPLPFDPDAVPVPATPVVTTPTTDVGETAVVNLDLVMSLDAPSPFPIAQPEAFVPALSAPLPAAEAHFEYGVIQRPRGLGYFRTAEDDPAEPTQDVFTSLPAMFDVLMLSYRPSVGLRSESRRTRRFEATREHAQGV